jgi:hypothetical protein
MLMFDVNPWDVKVWNSESSSKDFQWKRDGFLGVEDSKVNGGLRGPIYIV